ncbi:helix-hairpin-helix domain-containing protein [Streptomyces sp. NPDC060198]|uniref:helix-hairpin-helix domain-containing protein n=1 Tax=Streptomyces sp. NPDC060198 TaxID=3347070 RepID=UPI00364D2F9E
MALRSAPPRPFSSAPVLDVPALPGSAKPPRADPAHATGAPVADAAVAVSGAGPGRRARGRPTEETAAAARRRADALLGDALPADALPVRAVEADASVVRAVEADASVVRAVEAEGEEGAGTRTRAARIRAARIRAGDEPRQARTGAPSRSASALRERLPLWLQLRCGLEPRTVTALGVVLAGLAVLAGAHFWSAGPKSVRVPDAVRVAAEGSAVARTENAGADPVPSPPSPPARPPSVTTPDTMAADRIVVDVNGKVRRPGVQHLKAGARVADALHAAGGVLAGTDTTGLNRARILVDGEQVVVGLPMAPQPSGTAGAPGQGDGAVQAGPLSLNTATAEQLETLPGVGPVLAQHIVDHRLEHGAYGSVDELREVTGIGDRRFADLQPLVRP